jgi:hypothetical protein
VSYDNALAAVVAIIVLGYLVAALLVPERI